jgi:hypothetical protein
MKKIILSAILLFTIAGLYGQKKEIIYLKGGSVVKGRLMQIDGHRVAVRSGRSIWYFDDAEIDTITSGWNSATTAGVNNFFIKVSGGVLAGSSDNAKDTPFSFDASLNIRTVPGFFAGVGAGVDFLEESYMPVFLNLEYHFRESPFTPYIGLQGGYMVPLEGKIQTFAPYYDPYYGGYGYGYGPQFIDNKGGLMFNPSFGFISHISENLGWSLSFGYRYSQVTFKGDEHYQLETNYNRFAIKVGIIFN